MVALMASLEWTGDIVYKQRNHASLSVCAEVTEKSVATRGGNNKRFLMSGQAEQEATIPISSPWS